MKKILYIGNNLKGSNPTTFKQLSELLGELELDVYGYSHHKIILLRLVHMCWGVLKHRDASFVLIDTYSTLNFYYALIISQLARLCSIPYIPILHGGHLPSRFLKNPRLCRILFSKASQIVTPSLYLKEFFEKQQFQTILIPNAIDLNNYPFKKRTQVHPTLLWVRAFDEIYNPLMAVEVLSLLKRSYPSTTLCMIGPDKDGSMVAVQKRAESLGVTEALEITGFLTKEAWLSKAQNFDIFINTTTIDNTPVSVIEAMALGLPVVSTNVGGMPYLIDSYKNGILVANNNAIEMVAAIEELLNNAQLVENITMEAKHKIANFDVSMVKQQWNKLVGS